MAPRPGARLTVQPAIKFDLQTYIDDRVAAGESQIVIPPGRHLVTPGSSGHLVLKNLKNIVIDATGAELVCAQVTRAITIENCENLTLRGLVIDYDRLPFTQGRIVAISPDKTRVDFEIIPGYSDLAGKPYTSKIEVFDPKTDLLRQGRTLYGAKVKSTKPGSGSYERSPGQAAETGTEQIGDIAIIETGDAVPNFLPHVLFAKGSRGLVFENITVYSGPTFSFLEVECDYSRYVGCRVDRRPPELDYAARGHRRLRSVNADAFHSKRAIHGPRYERCSAYFNGDDSIAINGDFHVITGVAGAQLRVIAKSEMDMRVGGEVQLLAHDGVRLENRRIVAIEPAGETSAEDVKVIDSTDLLKSVRARGLKSAYTVALDAPAPLQPASYICSADAIGNGFVIENCDVGHNRSRGILVKAGRGRIANNRIEGSVMTAISINPESWWLEAGFADDLVIENNTIRNCGGTGIAVKPGNRGNKTPPPGAFRNITVRNNTILGGPAPGMVLTSIRGLVETNNTIKPDPAIKGAAEQPDRLLLSID